VLLWPGALRPNHQRIRNGPWKAVVAMLGQIGDLLKRRARGRCPRCEKQAWRAMRRALLSHRPDSSPDEFPCARIRARKDEYSSCVTFERLRDQGPLPILYQPSLNEVSAPGYLEHFASVVGRGRITHAGEARAAECTRPMPQMRWTSPGCRARTSSPSQRRAHCMRMVWSELERRRRACFLPRIQAAPVKRSARTYPRPQDCAWPSKGGRGFVRESNCAAGPASRDINGWTRGRNPMLSNPGMASR